MLELKEDQIAQLTRSASDADDKVEKYRLDCESLRKELAKMQEQMRQFKDDTQQRYDSYN